MPPTQMATITNVQPAANANNVLIDQNESVLVSIMCKYEEASSQA